MLAAALVASISVTTTAIPIGRESSLWSNGTTAILGEYGAFKQYDARTLEEKPSIPFRGHCFGFEVDGSFCFISETGFSHYDPKDGLLGYGTAAMPDTIARFGETLIRRVSGMGASASRVGGKSAMLDKKSFVYSVSPDRRTLCAIRHQLEDRRSIQETNLRTARSTWLHIKWPKWSAGRLTDDIAISNDSAFVILSASAGSESVIQSIPRVPSSRCNGFSYGVLSQISFSSGEVKPLAVVYAEELKGYGSCAQSNALAYGQGAVLFLSSDRLVRVRL